MKTLARLAALSVLVLAVFHGFAAARLFYILLLGRTTSWHLFGVVNCCDIPLTEVQMETVRTAAGLAAIAYAGRWLVPGLWRLDPAAWWGSLAGCLYLVLSHWRMGEHKVQSVQELHWQFMGLCLVPVVLLLVAAPLFFRKPDLALDSVGGGQLPAGL